MFLHSVWVFIASRILSGDTKEVSRTLFNSSGIDISARRTQARISVGSSSGFSCTHLCMDWKISISGAQKESLDINSFTDSYNRENVFMYLSLIVLFFLAYDWLTWSNWIVLGMHLKWVVEKSSPSITKWFKTYLLVTLNVHNTAWNTT